MYDACNVSIPIALHFRFFFFLINVSVHGHTKQGISVPLNYSKKLRSSICMVAIHFPLKHVHSKEYTSHLVCTSVLLLVYSGV